MNPSKSTQFCTSEIPFVAFIVTHSSFYPLNHSSFVNIRSFSMCYQPIESSKYGIPSDSTVCSTLDTSSFSGDSEPFSCSGSCFSASR